MANQNKIKDIWKRKDDYITSRIDLLSRRVDKSQNDLLTLMVEDYMGDFKTDAAGNLLANVHNTRLALKIDKLMDTLDTETLRKINTVFGNDMLKLTPISGKYYNAMGTPADVVKSIAEKSGFIEQSIGLKNGKIVKNGYIDTLTKAPEVRQALKDYVTTSVVNKKGFQEYLKGMKEIVVGTKTRDGVLERYYKQFAYDTFNDTDAAINKHYADSLDLTWFVYQGSIIETSRAFCRKRAGKTFNTEETEKWKCDSTLIGKPKGKKCDDKYNPLIQRGRWNCRHTIRYITEDLACNNGRKDACEGKMEEGKFATQAEIKKAPVKKPVTKKPTAPKPKVTQPKKVEWKPEMTKQEADIWGKSSKVKDTYYHGTTAGIGDKIRSGGFKLNKTTTGRIYGDGVYIAKDSKSAGNFASIFSGKTEVLKTRVNVKKPFRLKGKSSDLNEMLLDNGYSLNSAGVNKFLKDGGYDSLITKEFSRATPKGADIIMVIDPKNVVTLTN